MCVCLCSACHIYTDTARFVVETNSDANHRADPLTFLHKMVANQWISHRVSRLDSFLSSWVGCGTEETASNEAGKSATK